MEFWMCLEDWEGFGSQGEDGVSGRGRYLHKSKGDRMLRIFRKLLGRPVWPRIGAVRGMGS